MTDQRKFGLYFKGSFMILHHSTQHTQIILRCIRAFPTDKANKNKMLGGKKGRDERLLVRGQSDACFPHKFRVLASARVTLFNCQNLTSLDGFDTVVQKDIKNRSTIRGLAKFENVAKFAFDNVGSFVSSASIADALNTGKRKGERRFSHHTIENHLARLVGAFVLYKADRYDIHGKKRLKTQQKYYAVDLGLKNAVVGGDAGLSLGRKLENLVYLELRRRNIGDVWVGKLDGAEVDFVVQNNAGERAYYQVAWSAAEDETLERELRPLRKIEDNHPKFLVTADPDAGTFDGIRKINVINWLQSTE